MTDTPIPQDSAWQPEKRRHRQPEHSLQVQVNKFVRSAVKPPKVFLSFNRSKAQSMFQHAREHAAGIRKGTPDTVTMCPGIPDFWCELKAGKNTTSDAQDEVIADLRAIGRTAEVAKTVTEFFQKATAAGVPFEPGAAVMAMRLDGLLESAKVKARPRGAYGGKKERPATRAGLNALERARAKGVFA